MNETEQPYGFRVERDAARSRGDIIRGRLRASADVRERVATFHDKRPADFRGS